MNIPRHELLFASGPLPSRAYDSSQGDLTAQAETWSQVPSSVTSLENPSYLLVHAAAPVPFSAVGLFTEAESDEEMCPWFS